MDFALSFLRRKKGNEKALQTASSPTGCRVPSLHSLFH